VKVTTFQAFCLSKSHPRGNLCDGSYLYTDIYYNSD